MERIFSATLNYRESGGKGRVAAQRPLEFIGQKLIEKRILPLQQEARGVQFIEAAVASHNAGGTWVDLPTEIAGR